jgi:hypothetical protein
MQNPPVAVTHNAPSFRYHSGVHAGDGSELHRTPWRNITTAPTAKRKSPKSKNDFEMQQSISSDDKRPKINADETKINIPPPVHYFYCIN